MPYVIPVKFKYSARELWFDPKESGASEGDHVICNTARGLEMGLCTQDPFEISEETLSSTLGDAELSDIVRVASEADYKIADEMAAKSDEAFPIFKRLAKASDLQIKPVAAEFIFSQDKVVCYFAAEERVDFRQLVRDLSHELHARIDMRQIGVREEAALVGGFAHCGQELCCTRFGARFEPVSIRMAKEQDLPLNSAKISGACGRLMCCLRYEFEAYRDFKQRAPKRNAIIDTPLGKARIIEYDTPKEQLCLRLENGKQMRIDLADMTCSKHGEGSSCCGKDASEGSCGEGCGQCCRPDTVTRSVLDKLESPEIQMALDELDNKFAKMNDELEFAADDLFVEKRKPRRKSGGERAKSQQKDETQKQKPRRVRKPAQKTDTQAADTAAEKKPVRKRRRVSGGQGQAQKQPQEQMQSQGQAQKPAPKHAQAPKTADSSVAERKDKPRRRKRTPEHKQTQPQKTRRRPGDKGVISSEVKHDSQKVDSRQNKPTRVVRRTRRSGDKKAD